MNFKKSIEDISKLESKIEELSNSLSELNSKMQQIKTIADDAFIKASISHSLVVVRKISEEKTEKLNKLLD